MSQAYRAGARTRRAFLHLTLLAAAVALASPACASRRFDTLMKSWQGHPLEDLFRTWGPPNYLYSDGNGGQVIVYVPNPAPGTTRSGELSERLRAAARKQVFEDAMTGSWPIYRLFFADPTGRIVNTRWRGRWECCSG